MTLSFPSAARQAAALAAGSVSSRELTAHYLGAIAAANPSLHAYLEVFESAALAAADAADARRRAGSPRSAVDGVPVAIKDNICSTLGRTTCASKILENFRPPYDATTVTRLLDAGCVPLGKTNMDEFAMGSSCENSAFGPTRNPWDLTRVPGGSSGGSAAAVAGGLAPWALGSDTGGSIRQPASFCGIVGLKPTYGRVSRYGLVAFASSLDQIGPMTLDVADTALLLEVIAGYDPMDSTSSPSAPDAYSKDLLPVSLKGLRIGRPAEYFPSDGVDADVRAAMDGALRAFEDLGAEIVDVRLPHTEYAISCYYLVATAEASSNLARYDGAHYGYRAPGTTNIIDMFSRTRAQGFGAEVKRRIMIGTYALSAGYFDAYYMKALKVRTLIKQDFDEALSKVDVLVGPTTPSPAFGIGAKASDPLAMYLCDIFTIALNLAGTCGLSMPAGYSQGGLPIGLQLIGRPFGEKRLLQVAAALEAKLALPARVPSAAAAPMALG